MGRAKEILMKFEEAVGFFNAYNHELTELDRWADEYRCEYCGGSGIRLPVDNLSVNK